MALEPGLERTDTFVVEERMLTDVGGSLGVRVLSTLAMVKVGADAPGTFVPLRYQR